jgi:AraC family transcriptional regulator
MTIAGLRLHKLGDPALELPGLWQRFGPFIGRVPHQVPGIAFGVCMQSESSAAGVDYVAGCEVTAVDELPVEFSQIVIPAQRYAVFSHSGAATEIQQTVQAIFHDWLPRSNCTAVQVGADRVGFFERYGPGFDPQSASGDIELWVPIAG